MADLETTVATLTTTVEFLRGEMSRQYEEQQRAIRDLQAQVAVLVGGRL